MRSEIDEIKSRLNIVDVLSSYIKLEKAGINYRACCPFHKEKSPSFFVSPSRQIWHCFGGCNEGGDIFKFLMKIENIEFGEALRILAQKAGVELKTINQEEAKREKSEKEISYAICELSAKFFELYLKETSTGKKAMEYLKERGVKDETVKEWRIGYAPNTWSKLSEFLIGKGYERDKIIKAGLAIEKEGNKFFDRFRGRIIFPICDVMGKVAGFTGRVFGDNDDAAKYLNTPNTLLYDKSRIIFGFDKAKNAIKENEFCILVEGNMDCIMSHQAGMKNCVAVSGTALTEYHLNILKRHTSKLVLSFDMDLAGNNATKKAIRQAQLLDFDVRIIPSFGEKDPADIILHEGEEKWKELVNGSKPINQFYFESALKDRNAEKVEDKKKIAADFLPIIKQMISNIDQAYWIKQLSEALKISEDDIRKELASVRIEEDRVYQDMENKGEGFLGLEKKSRAELVDEEIMILILAFPEKVDLIGEDLLNSFPSPIKDVLLKIKGKKDIKTEEILKDFEDDSNVLNNINHLLMQSEIRKEKEIEIEKEIQICLDHKRDLLLKSERQKIGKEIKESEKVGDNEQVKILSEKFNKLSQNNKNE